VWFSTLVFDLVEYRADLREPTAICGDSAEADHELLTGSDGYVEDSIFTALFRAVRAQSQNRGPPNSLNN